MLELLVFLVPSIGHHKLIHDIHGQDGMGLDDVSDAIR